MYQYFVHVSGIYGIMSNVNSEEDLDGWVFVEEGDFIDPLETVTEETSLEDIAVKSEKAFQELCKKISEWIPIREEVIEKLNELADVLDKHQRNVNIAASSGASVSLVGAVMCIFPLTFPVGLGLTIAGGATSIGATATNFGLQGKEKKKANELIERDHLIYMEILRIMNYLTNATEQASKLLPTLTKLQVFQILSTGGSTASALFKAVKLGKTIQFIVTAERVAGVSRWAAATGQLVSMSAGKLLVRAAGAPLAIAELGYCIYKLAKGSKSTTGRELREKAVELKDELDELTELYKQLTSERS